MEKTVRYSLLDVYTRYEGKGIVLVYLSTIVGLEHALAVGKKLLRPGRKRLRFHGKLSYSVKKWTRADIQKFSIQCLSWGAVGNVFATTALDPGIHIRAVRVVNDLSTGVDELRPGQIYGRGVRDGGRYSSTFFIVRGAAKRFSLVAKEFTAAKSCLRHILGRALDGTIGDVACDYDAEDVMRQVCEQKAGGAAPAVAGRCGTGRGQTPATFTALPPNS